ncbi:hypothetical protein LTR84_002163 [Exophiala bonariae]|uniref:Uncharacterized protein n=1 Tax=Exophiala bonariae TaxID=1690606 RepID=A0AAV9NAH2_9EURO|nr:hypothetical protein LTR84_002163 [Exophiala bonariae]
MGVLIEEHPGNGTYKSFTKTWHNKSYPQISPNRPELRAEGKVVFVTGAGTGIGKATAIGFAQAGAKAIVIFGRRVDKLKLAAEEIRSANTNGTTTVIVEGVDLSDRAAVHAAFADAIKQLGGASIDVFVSNAGTFQGPGSVAGYDEDDFNKTIKLNMGSAFNSIKEMLPLLGPNATVLNITSGIAHIDAIPGQFWSYAVVKTANTKMFDYFQAENPNLRVFNVQPGVVSSEMNTYGGQDESELPAHFHVWLASQEADFLKGKFVWVNWDVDELKARASELKDSRLLKVLLHGVPM